MIHRRLFLGGLLGAVAAPAIVKAPSLMRVVPIARAKPVEWLCIGGGHGDGTCDGFISMGPLMAPSMTPYPAVALWGAAGMAVWEA